jgi:putative nucleotidyltransferase with HDIG domain
MMVRLRRGGKVPKGEGGEKEKKPLYYFIFESRTGYIVFLLIAITLLLMPRIDIRSPRYKLNDIAPRNIKAPRDIVVLDERATEERRRAAAEALSPVFDFDTGLPAEVNSKIRLLFKLGREKISAGGVSRARLEEFKRELPFSISDPTLRLFIRKGFSQRFEEGITSVLNEVFVTDIVGSTSLLEPFRGRGFVRRDIISGEEELVKDVSPVIDINRAEGVLGSGLSRLSGLDNVQRELLLGFLKQFITPDLVFNRKETEDRKKAAARNVEPVYYQVKKGEMIIREGDKIDEIALLKLKGVMREEDSGVYLAELLGIAIIVFLLFFVLLRYLEGEQKRRAQKLNLILLLGTVVILSIALMRVSVFIADSVAGSFESSPFKDIEAYYYAIPYAAGAMLVVLLLGAPTGIVFSLVFAAFVGIISRGNFYLSVYALVGGLSTIYGISRYRERSGVIKAGLVVSLVNIIALSAIYLITSRYSPVELIFYQLGMAFAGGLLTATFVSVMLPIFEWAFGITTDIKLLELSNLDNPLLRELALRSPGTYHHSVILGHLAEAAAKEVGGNPLLAMVASLYHDIGKVKMPEYFVENQAGSYNRHERLPPNMSALILKNHVKEGVEMAKEAGLPSEIIDIIREHHGTRIITYFYEKAKKLASPELGDIREEDFRYPGPKPRSKEAGIMMLADVVEAASRTLEEPTAARIKGLIKKIVVDTLLDGQLDECPLTFVDLERISVVFARLLVGIYHERVDYPGYVFEAEKAGKEKNGNNNKKQPSGLSS